MSLDQDPGTSPPLYGVAPQRTPVLFDAESRGLRIGRYEQRIDDPNDSQQVFSAYLSLLYAVRGAQPGQELKLRTADLEALLLIVGDDPGTIEKRLIGLMGCTPEEAKVLGGALLRHRRLTATLGIAASLALGGAVTLDGERPDGPARQDVAQSAVATTSGDAMRSPVASADDDWAPVLPAVPGPGFTGPVVSAASAPSTDTTSVLLAAATTRPAAAAPRGGASSRPAAASAPIAAAPGPPAPGAEPVDVVVQAPADGGVVMDAPPPVEDPLEGAIEIGEAVSMDHGSSFAPPAPDTTVAEPPVLHLPVLDVVIAPPATDDAPAAGAAADAPAAGAAEPAHDNRDGELTGDKGGADRGGPGHGSDGSSGSPGGSDKA